MSPGAGAFSAAAAATAAAAAAAAKAEEEDDEFGSVKGLGLHGIDGDEDESWCGETKGDVGLFLKDQVQRIFPHSPIESLRGCCARSAVRQTCDMQGLAAFAHLRKIVYGERFSRGDRDSNARAS